MQWVAFYVDTLRRSVSIGALPTQDVGISKGPMMKTYIVRCGWNLSLSILLALLSITDGQRCLICGPQESGGSCQPSKPMNVPVNITISDRMCTAIEDTKYHKEILCQEYKAPLGYYFECYDRTNSQFSCRSTCGPSIDSIGTGPAFDLLNQGGGGPGAGGGLLLGKQANKGGNLFDFSSFKNGGALDFSLNGIGNNNFGRHNGVHASGTGPASKNRDNGNSQHTTNNAGAGSFSSSSKSSTSDDGQFSSKLFDKNIFGNQIPNNNALTSNSNNNVENNRINQFGQNNRQATNMKSPNIFQLKNPFANGKNDQRDPNFFNSLFPSTNAIGGLPKPPNSFRKPTNSAALSENNFNKPNTLGSDLFNTNNGPRKSFDNSADSNTSGHRKRDTDKNYPNTNDSVNIGSGLSGPKNSQGDTVSNLLRPKYNSGLQINVLPSNLNIGANNSEVDLKDNKDTGFPGYIQGKAVEELDPNRSFPSQSHGIAVGEPDPNKSFPSQRHGKAVEELDPNRSFPSQRHGIAVGEPDPNKSFPSQSHGIAVGEPDPNRSFPSQSHGIAVGEPDPNRPYPSQSHGIAVGEPDPNRPYPSQSHGIAVGEPNPNKSFPGEIDLDSDQANPPSRFQQTGPFTPQKSNLNRLKDPNGDSIASRPDRGPNEELEVSVKYVDLNSNPTSQSNPRISKHNGHRTGPDPDPLYVATHDIPEDTNLPINQNKINPEPYPGGIGVASSEQYPIKVDKSSVDVFPPNKDLQAKDNRKPNIAGDVSPPYPPRYINDRNRQPSVSHNTQSPQYSENQYARNQGSDITKGPAGYNNQGSDITKGPAGYNNQGSDITKGPAGYNNQGSDITKGPAGYNNHFANQATNTNGATKAAGLNGSSLKDKRVAGNVNFDGTSLLTDSDYLDRSNKDKLQSKIPKEFETPFQSENSIFPGFNDFANGNAGISAFGTGKSVFSMFKDKDSSPPGFQNGEFNFNNKDFLKPDDYHKGDRFSNAQNAKNGVSSPETRQEDSPASTTFPLNQNSKSSYPQPSTEQNRLSSDTHDSPSHPSYNNQLTLSNNSPSRSPHSSNPHTGQIYHPVQPQEEQTIRRKPLYQSDSLSPSVQPPKYLNNGKRFNVQDTHVPSDSYERFPGNKNPQRYVPIEQQQRFYTADNPTIDNQAAPAYHPSPYDTRTVPYSYQPSRFVPTSNNQNNKRYVAPNGQQQAENYGPQGHRTQSSESPSPLQVNAYQGPLDNNYNSYPQAYSQNPQTLRRHQAATGPIPSNANYISPSGPGLYSVEKNRLPPGHPNSIVPGYSRNASPYPPTSPRGQKQPISRETFSGAPQGFTGTDNGYHGDRDLYRGPRQAAQPDPTITYTSNPRVSPVHDGDQYNYGHSSPSYTYQPRRHNGNTGTSPTFVSDVNPVENGQRRLRPYQHPATTYGAAESAPSSRTDGYSPYYQPQRGNNLPLSASDNQMQNPGLNQNSESAGLPGLPKSQSDQESPDGNSRFTPKALLDASPFSFDNPVDSFGNSRSNSKDIHGRSGQSYNPDGRSFAPTKPFFASSANQDPQTRPDRVSYSSPSDHGIFSRNTPGNGGFEEGFASNRFTDPKGYFGDSAFTEDTTTENTEQRFNTRPQGGDDEM